MAGKYAFLIALSVARRKPGRLAPRGASADYDVLIRAVRSLTAPATRGFWATSRCAAIASRRLASLPNATATARHRRAPAWSSRPDSSTCTRTRTGAAVGRHGAEQGAPGRDARHARRGRLGRAATTACGPRDASRRTGPTSPDISTKSRNRALDQRRLPRRLWPGPPRRDGLRHGSGEPRAARSDEEARQRARWRKGPSGWWRASKAAVRSTRTK